MIAVSLGGDTHKETLRKTLAMGADKAILLKDEGVRDSSSVARSLADALKGLAADVIFFGRQSVDSDDAAVGGMVAEMLGLPSASSIVKLEVTEGRATAEREIEGAGASRIAG